MQKNPTSSFVADRAGAFPIRSVSKDVIRGALQAVVGLGWGLYSVPPLRSNGINAFLLYNVNCNGFAAGKPLAQLRL